MKKPSRPAYAIEGKDAPPVQGVGLRCCAFCKGQYDASPSGAVVHTSPPCEVFDDLEPDVYLTACRLAWQRLRGQFPPEREAN